MTRISLADDYDGDRVINSPRSIMACQSLGIEVEELLRKPRGTFMLGVPHHVGALRFRHFEEQRINLIHLALAQRERLILQHSPEQECDINTTTSSTQHGNPGRSLGAISPDQKGDMSRGIARASASPSRSVSRCGPPHLETVRELDRCYREELSVTIDMSLQHATMRKQEHLDALSNDVGQAVLERVRRVRERWVRQEEQMSRQHAMREQQKEHRIASCRSHLSDKYLTKRIEGNTTREIRAREAKERVVVVNSERRQRLCADVMRDDQRCQEAVMKVRSQQIETSSRKQEKLEAILHRAATLKSQVDHALELKAVALEEILLQKQAAVEANRYHMQHEQCVKNHTRRSYFDAGERLQRAVRQEQQRLRQQKEIARAERMRSLRMERDLYLETRSEMELDRLARAQRSRRAMEFMQRQQQSKQEEGIIIQGKTTR